MKWSHVAVLAPGFYFSRLFGVTPSLVRRNRDGTLEFRAHKALFVITLLMTLAMVYSAVYASSNHLPKAIKSRSPWVPYTICMVLSYYGSIVVLGSAYFYHRHTVRAFNEVHELSRQLIRHLDNNRLNSEAFFAPLTFAFTSLRYVQQTYTFGLSFMLSAYQWGYLIFLSSHSVATAFLFYVESFLKCLNTELAEIRLNLNSTPTEIQTRIIVRRLKHLQKVYNRICDLNDTVCERFSLDIFIIFGIVVSLLVSTLYEGIWVHNIDFPWTLNVLNTAHYGFLISRLAHVCYRSDCVMQQSQVTIARVHSLTTPYLPAEIKQEIYHFTLQTMLRKVEITACGYYGLRMETITTLLYMITTYLVLVINLFEPI